MAAMGHAELPVKGQMISPGYSTIIDIKGITTLFHALSYGAGISRLLGEGMKGRGVFNVVIKIMGSVSEIRIIWRCKPGLRIKMIRYMMKQKGRPGVMALAKALNMTYNQLNEIGGLEGWIRRRNCQRRQRQKRQERKTDCFSIESTCGNSNTIHVNGAGKRGKEGGRQDIGSRLIAQSVYN